MKEESKFIQNQPEFGEQKEQLRKKAKEGAKYPEQNTPMSPDEVKSLLYDLHLHQEELRIQNEDLRKTQWQLAMARDQFMELFEFAPVGYLTLDLDRRITRANLTAASMIGVDRGGLEGMLLADYVSEDQQDHFHRFFQKMLHPEENQTSELTFQRKDGSTFIASVEGRRLEADAPAEGCYFIVLSDITRLKEIQEDLHRQRELLQSILDNVPVMITIYDPEMKSFWGNRACREILGWSTEDMAQEGFIEKCYPNSVEREKVIEFMQNLRQGWNELQVACKDGSVVESLWANIMLGDRTQVGIGLDVREQKEAERKLQGFNTILEQRVRERTEEAENRTMQLQMLAMRLTNAEDRERRRIAETLHDDLQQHLAAIKFALRKFVPYIRNDEPGKKHFREIDQLIDEGIRKTRNLSHELVPSVLRHQGFLPAMQWMVREMGEKHGLEVQLELDQGTEPASSGLASILYRCVRELLFNVLKHSGVRAAKIKVMGRGDKIEILVKDGGRGCDPEQLRKNRNKGGMGLFSIEERMTYLGGGMDIDSAPGKGCKIYLNVPINAMIADEESQDNVEAAIRVVQQNVEQSQKANQKKQGGKIRILLVDDHDLVREGIASVLEEEPDMEVVAQASDGNEAIFMAHEFTPDVVLMDVSMPNKDGVEATREIKNRFSDMQVIGLSMHDEPDFCESIVQAGATAFVSKTDSPEELIQWIRRAKPSSELPEGE